MLILKSSNATQPHPEKVTTLTESGQSGIKHEKRSPIKGQAIATLTKK